MMIISFAMTLHRSGIIFFSKNFSLLLLMVLINVTNSMIVGETYQEAYERLLTNEGFEKIYKSLTPKAILDYYKIHRDKTGLSDNCVAELDRYLLAIEERKPWALKMLDASSKIPTGILAGNIIDLGSFDECLDIEDRFNRPTIKSQHCMYEFNLTQQYKYLMYNPELSICLPNKCTKNDLLIMIEITAKGRGNATDFMAFLPTYATCTRGEFNFWDDNTFVIMLTFGLCLIFFAFCTIHDILNRCQCTIEDSKSNNKSKLVRFSLLKNAEDLLNLESSENNLAVVNGLRFVSTMSVVLLHVYLAAFVDINSNFFHTFEWLTTNTFIIIMFKTLSVDTFFTLSGFFMAYGFYNRVQRNNFSFFHFYMHRFIRLTGPMIIFLITVLYILPKFLLGPRANFAQDIFLTPCSSKWWTLLFYVQNVVDRDNYCLLEMWTNSVDMQLFTLTLLILWITMKKPTTGIAIIFLLSLSSITSTAFVVGKNEYSMTLITPEANLTRHLEAFNNVYFPTYIRATPYFFGILLAFFVQNKKWKLPKIFYNLGWLLVIVIIIIIVIILKYVLSADYEYILILEIFGSAVARPVWSLIICWIIFCSINNEAGLVSKFLSLKCFLPLSKLSYSIYLIHVYFLFYYNTTSRSPNQFKDWWIFRSFLGYFMMMIILGFFHTIVIEMPICAIDELLLRQKRVIVTTKTNAVVDEKSVSTEKNLKERQ